MNSSDKIIIIIEIRIGRDGGKKTAYISIFMQTLLSSQSIQISF